MIGKYLVNDHRIDGLQLLENKFRLLTRRQIVQLYDHAKNNKLSVEDIKKVNMTNPLAKVGERFGITVELND